MSGESRKLSDEEVAALGLPPAKEAVASSSAQSRKLSDDEVAQLGLPPAEKAMRVPSPTGWKPAGEKAPFYDLNKLQNDFDKQNTGMWGALAAGAHGPAMAMEGPVNGAIAALKTDFVNSLKGTPDPNAVTQAYRGERDRIEGAQRENLKQHPVAPVFGAALTGAIGSAPSLAGRLGLSLAQGGLYGFGSSKADLTKGEVKPALADTAIGAGIGGAGALAGEALNAGGGLLARKLGDVLGKNDAAARAAAEKAFAAARGSYGGEVSSASRTLELLEKAASDPNLPEELSRQAAEFLAGPEAAALKQQVIRSSLGRGSDQLGRIQGARDAMAEAGQALQPDAVAAAAQRRLDDPGALARRLRELFPKLFLPAVGGALAGPAGAGAGALSAAVLGRSGTTVRNMLTDPYVSSRVLAGGSAGLRGAGGATARSSLPLAEYLGLLDEEKSQ